MNTVFIYSLADPRTGEIRYVGKSKDPSARIKKHIRQESKTHKWYWLKSLGIPPQMEILDEVPEDEWKFWEQHWIQLISGWGFNLTNGDRGGLGYGRITNSIREKIAKTLTGRSNTPLAKRIYAYDLKTGLQVAAYPSVAAAAKAVSGSHSNIVNHSKNGRASYGFAWSYEDLPEHRLPNRVDGRYVAPPSVIAKIVAKTTGRKLPPVSEVTRQRMRDAALRHRGRSRAAMDLFMPKLEAALQDGQEVFIDIRNPQ